MNWKPLVYRGVDYGQFYEVSDEGHIKRRAYKQISIYGYVQFDETIHKPKDRFNVVVKPLKIRVDIDVKRAVAENFMPRDKHYHFVLRYDDEGGNGIDNIYWSNQPKKLRLPSTYNRFRQRDELLDREIVKAYENGLTFDEMIKMFNKTRTYLRRALDSHGIKREQVRNRANYNIDLEEMRSLFIQGKTLREVADHFDISKYLASYYKGVLGLKAKTKIIPLKEKNIYE